MYLGSVFTQQTLARVERAGDALHISPTPFMASTPERFSRLATHSVRGTSATRAQVIYHTHDVRTVFGALLKSRTCARPAYVFRRRTENLLSCTSAARCFQDFDSQKWSFLKRVIDRNGCDRGTVRFCGDAGAFRWCVRHPEVAGMHGRARPIVCSASIISC